MQNKPPTTATTTEERAQNLFQNAEILAPMVRASSTPLRILALHYGADLVFTEEIVDRSITTQTERIENTALGTIDYVRKLESFSPKVQRRMKELPVILRMSPKEERGRLIYQMGTGEANLALEAAERVYADVDGIDLNMGCPKKFSVSGGMGAALLKDLPRAKDILSTLRRNLPQKVDEAGGGGGIPLSCKIRLLKDVRSTVDFVLGLVQAGANAVTIHGREAGDEPTNLAKWDRLVEVVRLLKSTAAMDRIPVIINGDLYTRNDMINLRRKSGADGVMLARPALYNTSIFRKPPPPSSSTSDSPLQNQPSPTPPPHTTTEEETRYGYDSPLLLSKTTVVKDYLTYAKTYQTHYKNVKYVICEMMNNRRTPSTLAHYMPQKYPGMQSIDKVCKCRSIEDFYRVWDVSTSAVSSSSTTTTAAAGLGMEGTDGIKIRSAEGTCEGHEGGDVGLLHKYDDRYFLDPEGLRKARLQQDEMEEREELQRRSCAGNIIDEKKEASSVDEHDVDKGGDGPRNKVKRARLETG